MQIKIETDEEYDTTTQVREILTNDSEFLADAWNQDFVKILDEARIDYLERTTPPTWPDGQVKDSA